MLNHDPAARTHNRLGFMISMVLALHVAVILGVGFYLKAPKPRIANRLDITLSHYHEKTPVHDADFLAQGNQSASGTESEKKEMTSTQMADIHSMNDQPAEPVEQRMAKNEATNKQYLTTRESHLQIQKTIASKDTRPSPDTSGQDAIDKRRQEIAALKAKLDAQKQAYARLPNTRRLSSVATKSADDAAYLFKWQQRIELIGNEYYPEAARKQGTFGDLQLLVHIDRNGQLIDTRILKSSGKKVLDQAALRIVKLAAPFDPLPPEVLKNAQSLEIIRTWQFKKNRFSRHIQ